MDNYHRYGFRWAPGQGPMPKPEVHFVADSYQAKADDDLTSVDLNVGDPVKIAASGGVELAQGSEPVYGIIVGVLQVYDSALGVVKHYDRVPGGTNGGGKIDNQSRVLVVPAKWGKWEIDVDDKVTATTEAAYQALIHRNVEHVNAGDVSDAARPKADPRIDISGHDTTAGMGWRIVGISKTRENRDFSGANVKIIVRVNDSVEPGAAATTVAGV